MSTLVEMAAAYHFHLAKTHAFVDGNKRIAVAAAFVFLYLNDLELDCSEDMIVELTLHAASARSSSVMSSPACSTRTPAETDRSRQRGDHHPAAPHPPTRCPSSSCCSDAITLMAITPLPGPRRPVDAHHPTGPPSHHSARSTTITTGLLVEILEMQQLEGHPRSRSLGVQLGEVGQWPRRRPHRRRRIKPPFQLVVLNGFDRVQVEPGARGPVDGVGYHSGTRSDAERHLAVAPPELPLLPQNLSCLPHGQSLRGHRPLVEDNGS